MRKILLIAIAMCTTALVGFAQSQKIVYPKTAKGNTVDEYFGVKVADPYRWLENDTSAATANWVKAENKVTSTYLAKIPYRQAILNRLKTLANYEKINAPFKKNGKFYFSKNNGLQNQYVIYVQDTPTSEARVFLDPNKLSTDGTVALKGLSFSHNGKYAAYRISRSGSDWEEIYVIDLATGKLLDDHILWAKFTNSEWLGDGFYYSGYDAPVKGKEFSNINENHKIYYHKIGTPQSEDKLVFQNPNKPKRFYGISTNKEETMLFLDEGGDGTGNVLYVKDLTKANSDFVQMSFNMNETCSPSATIGSKIYLFTNHNAPKGCMMIADVNNPSIQNWQTLIPEAKDVLTGASIIGDKIILTYSKDAADHAYVYSMDGKLQHEIKLPTLGSVDFSGEKGDKDCYYTISSYTMPSTIYEYDLDNNTSKLYRTPKTAFDSQKYVTEQVFYTSKDGTKIPMFLTHKKGLKLDGKNPVLLYGYGGFAISMNPYFSTSFLPFMEQGGIYAVANLRGGSEYGEAWHQAGIKMHKQNVFDDFIAAAEYLIAKKYTSKSKLAILGGSNGGLLVGACMTQRPDLFKVAIAEVGVMDMLRYHKFTIGWNWACDYGTSEDNKAMFEYLKGYSPLHNLKPGTHYPATLVATADHDDRVVPAHSFKFAATLQACNAGNNPTLIRIDSKAGHGGGKPMSKQLEEMADIISFIMYNMGLKYQTK
jgi:prolyl oligopeptidase